VKGLLRLVFVPLLKQQCPEFLIDASAGTDKDDIQGGFVIIGTEDNAIRSDPIMTNIQQVRHGGHSPEAGYREERGCLPGLLS
jgi:hypothetical protein